MEKEKMEEERERDEIERKQKRDRGIEGCCEREKRKIKRC